MTPRRTINNRYNLTTIYVAKDKDKATWVDGRKAALDRGLSMSQYVLTLIREDVERNKK